MDSSERETRSPETLPEDIYNILDDDTDHEVSEENVELAAELLKGILRRRFQKRERVSGESVLRFSSLGKKDRQLWYQANMPEVSEKIHGKQNFKFLYGDVIELLLLFLAMEAGHEVKGLQQSVECDGVKGSIDAIIDGVLVDVKSASPYSFEKFKSGGVLFDDPFGYVAQLGGYAQALEADGSLDKGGRAGWLVGEKVNGSIEYVELDREYIAGNDPAPRINHLREVIRSSVPPARCYDPVPEGKSGNLKLPVGCSYCPFKFECHKDANGGQGLKTFLYSRGPVFLTHVAKAPKVDEITT